MLIIPAIDIKDGCVVRLVQGRLSQKIYSRSPLETARHWVKQGAKFIHIVDLDGAATGSLQNLRFLKQIKSGTDAKIEFGGGVRNIETIKRLLDLGIERVVLGTRAIEDRVFLRGSFKRFKDRVIVSLDARDSKIYTKGWQRNYSRLDLLDFARGLKKMGFKQIIYTDISKDGTLKGPNIKGIKHLLKGTGLSLIASGGICSLDDIYRLKLMEGEGVIGVIVGKALYEGKFTLQQALKLA
jgi:phosphoribosylformimino-5-aminoimidazole carboxamide ribotide isomerase